MVNPSRAAIDMQITLMGLMVLLTIYSNAGEIPHHDINKQLAN